MKGFLIAAKNALDYEAGYKRPENLALELNKWLRCLDVSDPKYIQHIRMLADYSSYLLDD